MVMQSGEVPAGRKDTNPVKIPWKYIAIAAIAVALILSIFAALNTFSNQAPAATTSSGWQPPENPNPGGGVIPPDEPDNKPKKIKITRIKDSEIPSPDEIVPVGTLIDISNPPKFMQEGPYTTIADLEISDTEIRGTILNTAWREGTTSTVYSVWFTFYSSARKYEINGREGYIADACSVCLWPIDYDSGRVSSRKIQEYWDRQGGVPVIARGEKIHFSIRHRMRPDTKFFVLGMGPPQVKF